MKSWQRKSVALLLSAIIGATVVTGCSTSSSTSSDSGDTVYGQVTKVGENSITVDVGTKKEQSQPEQSSNADSGSGTSDTGTGSGTQTEDSAKSTDSASTENNADSSKSEQSEQAEAPSMLDLTGESKEISITDDTELVRESMGGAPNGGEQPPEKPDSDSDSKPSDSAASSKSASDTTDSDSSESKSSDSSSDGDSATSSKSTSDTTDSDSSKSKSSDSSSDSDSKSEPPEKPDGESGSDSAADGESEQEISLSDISEGDTVEITYADDGSVEKIAVISPGGAPGGQQSAEDVSYTAANEYTEDTEVDGDTLTSTGTDENAALLSADATVSLKNVTVKRKSSESKGGDNSSFYGIGASVLATKGTLNVENAKITSNAAGGAGVFAYGDSVVNVSDSTISTKKDTSGGIHVAGGGTLHASNLTVTTQGESSAAIRSDRGGGTMTVDGGTYTSNGTGSPAIYSTANIAAQNATLTANGSEAVCIEGKNSVHLYNSDLSGNMSDNEQNDCTWNVILYQSMSGDSEEGNSTFEMNGGTLTAKRGGMFYTTNTESTITLSDVKINYSDDNPFFLQCTGNTNQRGWGTAGANGADCLFTAIQQEMEGDVVWDSISQLDFYMTDGSSLTGAFVNDETYAGDGGDGYCKLYIDKDSTWTVTGDSTVTELQNEGKIVDESGKTVTIQGSDGTTYVKGDSEYTVTVTSSYSDTADCSGASSTTTYADYTA